jgi:hypothetical protein
MVGFQVGLDILPHRQARLRRVRRAQPWRRPRADAPTWNCGSQIHPAERAGVAAAFRPVVLGTDCPVRYSPGNWRLRERRGRPGHFLSTKLDRSGPGLSSSRVSTTSRQRRPASRPGEAQWPGSSKVLSEFCWPPPGSRQCGHRRSRGRRKSELSPRPVHADRPSGD